MDYIRICLLNADSKWASHIPYLLWSCNLLVQHRLHDAVCISMRIRSSAAYWQRAKLGLFVMFHTLGAPTFSLTLSAHDIRWTDLLYILTGKP